MDDPITSGTPIGAPGLPPTDQPAPRDMAPPAGDQARPATGGTEPAAPSLADQAKHALFDTMDRRKGAAADMVEQLAQSVRQSGEQFEGQQDWIAGAIGRGAAELSSLADSIRAKDLGDLAREVDGFARRRPALFIGAALAGGFAVARLGKIAAGDLSREDLPSVPAIGSSPEVDHGQH